jgi:hypothetical protein
MKFPNRFSNPPVNPQSPGCGLFFKPANVPFSPPPEIDCHDWRFDLRLKKSTGSKA